MAGRRVDLIVTDTGGNPAGAKTMVRRLVEQDHVDVILGPLAAFELLAIIDYITENKTPTLNLAGADDVTQRQSVFSAAVRHVVPSHAANGRRCGESN